MSGDKGLLLGYVSGWKRSFRCQGGQVQCHNDTRNDSGTTKGGGTKAETRKG